MLRLTTEAGEALAFAKVGSSPVASALVRQETAALTRVADVGWQSIRAPRVLRVGELRGRAPGHQRAGRRRRRPAARGAAGGADPGDRSHRRARRPAAGRDRSPGAPSRGDPGPRSAELAALADRLRDLGDRRLPLGAARTATGRRGTWPRSGDVLEVWDWERSDTDVPQGSDAIHFAAARVRATGDADDTDEAERRFLAELPGAAGGLRRRPCPHQDPAGAHLLHAGRRYAADLDLVPVPAVEARLAWAAAADRPDRPDRARSARMNLRKLTPPSLRLRGRQAAVWYGERTASRRPVPDFLVIGGQRCGTTSLFRALMGHPQIRRPQLHKGVNYFDLNYDRGPAWYRGHFPVRGAGDDTRVF
ncbi:MAG: hypothetical protein R2734_14545 [Nocardioides sp.]